MVMVMVAYILQPPNERAHSGSQFGKLVGFPEHAVAGTKEGISPHLPFHRQTSPVPVLALVVCRYGGIHAILSTAYDMCALPGGPIVLRAGGDDAAIGCSMLPLNFLVVSRSFTRSRSLVMRANGYWCCVGVVQRACSFAPATLCQNFNPLTYFRLYKHVGLPADRL